MTSWVVLKVNLHSLGVAFLIFFSHFSPIFGPFQEEKYVSRNYVENDLWTAIAWQYVSYFNKRKRRNPPGNWVILILSGQKSCKEYFKEYYMLFYIFQGLKM